MKKGEKGPSIQSLNKQMTEKSKETDDRLLGIENSVSEISKNMDSKFDSLLKSMETFKPNKSVMAKNNPNIIAKDGTFAEDVYQHLDEHEIEFTKGDPNDDVETLRPGLTSVHSAEFQEKADQMRFDEEEIEIMVMSSQSTYPDHTFTIGVNGRTRMIMRGRKQWLPRKYVEVLLRAKISSYGNFETTDHMTNEQVVKNPETKSHRYPLQILTDKNPRGTKWLERVTNDINT